MTCDPPISVEDAIAYLLARANLCDERYTAEDVARAVAIVRAGGKGGDLQHPESCAFARWLLSATGFAEGTLLVTPVSVLEWKGEGAFRTHRTIPLPPALVAVVSVLDSPSIQGPITLGVTVVCPDCHKMRVIQRVKKGLRCPRCAVLAVNRAKRKRLA